MAGKGSMFLKMSFGVGFFFVLQLLRAHPIFYVISSDTKNNKSLMRSQCPASLAWFSPAGPSW